MKAMNLPKQLPMKGRRKAGKLVKLAQQIDRPEYFQHLINSLQTENTDVQESSEEVVEQPVAQEIRQEGVKGKPRRKAIKTGGLFD